MVRLTDSSHLADPLRRRLRRLSRFERLEEAKQFIALFHRECGLSPAAHAVRWREVARDLRRHGFYRHTSEELAFGARAAWRNSARCIGRLTWKSLEVVDCRHVTQPDEIAGHLAHHATTVLEARRTPSMISIFGPVEGDRLPTHVESPQLLQFAGYSREGEEPLGDPQNVELTRTCMALGWQPPSPPSAFDLLPIIVRDAAGRRRVYELPARTRRVIPIKHPAFPGLSDLGLHWYATPIVSDMILTIGGIDYPCAPFNGHYMSTEIGSRNFLDEARYDLSETIREAIGLQSDDPFWRDRVALALNEAVLQSFRSEGVSVIDPHSASEQYIEFCNAEHKAGRLPSGDWAWIVPPMNGSTCPVFHLAMTNYNDVPNFYRSRAIDGVDLKPSYAVEQRSSFTSAFSAARRRVLRRLSSRY